MNGNKIEDFINTRYDTPIRCASCGSWMTLKSSATYRTLLTDNARRQTENYIQTLRAQLLEWEWSLREYNFATRRPEVYDPIFNRDVAKNESGFEDNYELQGEDPSPYFYERILVNGMGDGAVAFENKHADEVRRTGMRYNNATLFLMTQAKYLNLFQRENALAGLMKAEELYDNLEPLNGIIAPEEGPALYEPLLLNLILALESPIISGPVLDIVLNQPKVKEWTNKVNEEVQKKIKNAPNGQPNPDPPPRGTAGEQDPLFPLPEQAYLAKRLQEYIPRQDGDEGLKYLFAYLAAAEHIIRQHKGWLSTQILSKKEDGSPQFLKERKPAKYQDAYHKLIRIVERALFASAILHAQNTQNSDNKNLIQKITYKDDVLGTQGEFTLAKDVFVEPILALRLVLWVRSLDGNVFGINEEQKAYKMLHKFLSTDTDWITKHQGDMIALFEDILKKVVRFCCTGPAASELRVKPKKEQPEEPQGEILPEEPHEKPAKKRAYNRCGWYPKAGPTHSILFFGSPGCGKTNVLLSGLMTVRECLKDERNMFFRVAGEQSHEELAKFTTFFDNHLSPRPTKSNERHVFEIEIGPKTAQEDLHKEEKKQHFVFIDIPGELAARANTQQGADPLVMSILQTAKYMVFFYDLTLERTYWAPLVGGAQTSHWDDLSEVRKTVKDDRKGRDKKERDPSRADVEQEFLKGSFFDLLDQLRLKKPKDGKPSHKKHPDVECLVVIPKADIFAHMDTAANSEENMQGIPQGEPKVKFLTQYFLELQKEALLIPQYDNPDAKIKDLESRGAAARENSQSESLDDRIIEDADKIDLLTRVHLENIGQGMDGEGKGRYSKVLRRRLTDLYDDFDKMFGKTRFMAISAKGQPDDESKSELPPAQKLAEFVFLTPIASCWQKSTEAPQQPESEDNDENPTDLPQTSEQ